MIVPGETEIVPTAIEEGLNAIYLVPGGGASLNMNNSAPPFDDVRARQALWYAIDWQDFNDTLNPGLDPATALFTPETFGYDSAYDLPQHDPSRAQELLDELAADDKPLTFTFTATAGNAAHIAIGQYLQTNLASYDNVEVNVEQLAAADSLAQTAAMTYQIKTNAIWFASPYPELTNVIGSNGIANTLGYSNPDVDDAIASISAATSEAELETALGVIQRRIAEDVPFLLYQVNKNGVVVSDRLSGIELYLTGYLFNWEDVSYSDS
jgi:peptide/nickel transport system substrate-binding protein